MKDAGFGFVHAVFHVVLFFIVHGHLRGPRKKPSRNQEKPQKRRAAARLSPDQIKITNITNERRSNEACSQIPKPVALSKELQTRTQSPNQAGETEIHFSSRSIWSETTNQNRRIQK
jgi:hypothetical protein